MKRIFRDDRLQEQFEARGYAVKPMLSEVQATALLKEVGELRPDDGFNPRDDNEFCVTYHMTQFDSNLAYKSRVAELASRWFARFVNETLSDYSILTSALFVKPAGKGEFGMHCDWTVAEDPTETTINLWCPLVDVDEANGALQFVEGSHGIIDQIQGPGIWPYYAEYAAELTARARSVPMKAGEVIMFDSNMLHCSPPNRSSEARFAIRCMCIPRDVRPVLHRADPASQGKRIEIFDMDRDAYSRHTGVDLVTGNFRTRRLGCVENRNIHLSQADLARLIGNGDRIRSGERSARDFLDGPGPGKPSFIQRLRNAIRV